MSDLLDQFLDPPMKHRPRVWWHWMNGNIDKAGLVADLDWMHKTGIGGVQIFEGGMNAAQVVDERVVYRSDSWFELFAQAVSKAGELGLEVSVASSAGWSVMGAPWVKPEAAMKKLVWSETEVNAGSKECLLKPLPSNEGSFQDAPRWGKEPKHNFARDYACLAVPNAERFRALMPYEISLSREFEGKLTALTDSSYASWISLPKQVEANDEVWCLYDFSTKVSVGSATIGISGPTGFGSPELPKAYLDCSNDGVTFTEVAHFPMETTMGQSGEVVGRTISFPITKARFFRLRLQSRPMSEALPRLQQGVAGLPFKPQGFDQFHISEFALFSGGRVHGFEYKAGFGIAKDYFRLELNPGHSDLLEAKDVIDVSEFFDPHTGVLSWTPPAGQWRIFRIGYSLTGAENGPAPEEATGLEVDKLDPGRIQEYLTNFFEPLFEGLEKQGVSKDKIAGLLSDSIESKAQNFTESLPTEFENRRGYSLRPWLMALTGWVVGDARLTDKFLYDFRLTISELVSDCMYALLGDFAQQHNSIYYSEALESHRPQLGDDLEMRSKADVPMGAMWAWAEDELPIQTYIADLKGAASVSHIYGKRATGCESFSSYGKPFSFSPRSLKKVADLELALGVTVFNIHSSPHQPSAVAAPGVTLAPTLGQVFTRNETWAQSARPWVDYLSRCSMLLNSGLPKADILYFTGEEAPVTAIFGDDEFDVPSGYDFDLVSTPGLSQIRVDGDVLRSSQGRYKLLYLGGQSHRLSGATLKKLTGLADSGAKIFGSSQISSHTLSDSQVNYQDQLQTLVSHKNFFECETISEALEKAEALGLITKDWEIWEQGALLNTSLVPEAEARCIRRTGADFDLYFVSNAQNRSLDLELKVSAVRKYAYLLNPVTPGLSVSLGSGELHSYQFELEPYGSRFLYLSDVELDLPGTDPEFFGQSHLREELDSWQVKVDQYDFEVSSVFDWSRSDDESLKYHSGSVSFTTTLRGLESQGNYQLVFPEIAELAEVFLNGKLIGTIWAHGQRIDISKQVLDGDNRLELVITNNWRNRLLGDQFEKSRFPVPPKTYIGYPIFEPDADLLPAGILRPVVLERLIRTNS